MIEIVLLVLLILLIRTKFTIFPTGGVFMPTKCGNCDYIESRRGVDEVHLDFQEDYHYCSVAEKEVQPSDTSCRYYK